MTPGPQTPLDLDPPLVVVARATDDAGEVVLRRRPGPPGAEPVVELVVDGVFAMDTVDTSSERALAAAALHRLEGTALRVLVGGLGLGCTAAALLVDPRVAAVDVVELHPALLRWAALGLLPGLRGPGGEPLADRRLRLRAGDVASVLAGTPESALDAVVLDVDNGPDFLVHACNARLYAPHGLTTALRVLRPGGVLAVWSSDPSPALEERLRSLPLARDVEQRVLPVRREGRDLRYAVLLATRA